MPLIDEVRLKELEDVAVVMGSLGLEPGPTDTAIADLCATLRAAWQERDRALTTVDYRSASLCRTQSECTTLREQASALTEMLSQFRANAEMMLDLIATYEVQHGGVGPHFVAYRDGAQALLDQSRDVAETLSAVTQRRRQETTAREQVCRLRVALSIMLEHSPPEHWTGREIWREKCQAAYDETQEIAP